jgi:hypothetical protein
MRVRVVEAVKPKHERRISAPLDKLVNGGHIVLVNGKWPGPEDSPISRARRNIQRFSIDGPLATAANNPCAAMNSPTVEAGTDRAWPR